MEGRQYRSPWRQDTEIFLVSAAILFQEVMLIRWIGTEIRVFAFLGNLVLLVCFFATGLGCYLATRPVRMGWLGLQLAALAFLVANPFHLQVLDFNQVTDLLAGFEDMPLWSSDVSTGGFFLKALGLVALVLFLTMSVFKAVGQLLGRAIQEHPRTIEAYSANIAGSLVGIWLFNGLSWAATAPVWWFAVLAILLATVASLMGCRSRSLLAGLGVGLVSVWFGSHRGVVTVWSPYQKLEVEPLFIKSAPEKPFVSGFYQIRANGTGYQLIWDLSDDFLRLHPDLYDPQLLRLSHYNLAFYFKPEVHRLLIVGAGAGNNAAAALRHGVAQIDCVEIDPEIYELGKKLHPEHPYDSPRVHMYITDARAFMKRATGPYDMVWFGLLDTNPGSSYNNRRLDQYVYTLQSFQEARRLLAPDGVLLVNFSALRPWVIDRLYGLLTRVFGHPPLAFYLGAESNVYGSSGELTLVTGNKERGPADLPKGMEHDYLMSNYIRTVTGTTRPTTDDWPYLYLEHARIPKLYWIVYLILVAMAGITGREIWGRGRGVDGHFFALGAAFLLLEVQTVSRAALLFGTTWGVNAIVVSAVLVMVLLSNIVAARWPRLPRWAVGTGLAVSVAALALVPLDWFNTLTGVAKLLAASAFLTVPVFFAGLIFIRSFASCADKTRALGSNLIGALVGGVLESLSFVAGIRALVLLVGVFYALAFRLKPRLSLPPDLPSR